jgi:cobalamin biosynthesis protein CobT
MIVIRDVTVQRRKFLLATGTVTTTVLAGCAGDTDDEGGDNGEAKAAEEDENGEEEDDGEADANGEDENDEEEEDEEEEVDPDEALEDDDVESTVDGLEILEHELVEEEFSVAVEGVVANNTGDELGYVEVGVVAYNDEGQRIDDSFTNTTDLPDGEEWAFEVLLTEDAEDIDEYSIAVTDSAF